MSIAEEFEEYALEIAGDDNAWVWEMDFQTGTTPSSIYASEFLFGEEKEYGVADIKWSRGDISVTASINAWEVKSPDDWLTFASITRENDRVSTEFHSKDSTISGLKAALTDPESLLGPFKSSLIDEIDRRTQGRFRTELKPGAWSTVGEVSMQSESINASLMHSGESWNLAIIESEPVVEGGYIVDYEPCTRANLSFKDEKEMLDALEQWIADPRGFF